MYLSTYRRVGVLSAFSPCVTHRVRKTCESARSRRGRRKAAAARRRRVAYADAFTLTLTFRQICRRRSKLSPAGASPPPHVRHAPRRLTLTLFHAHVMHVSLFGKFADVGVSCSSRSSPRRTLSLLYCNTCPRHSTTLRTTLTNAQGEGHCTGRGITELGDFFRPCSQTGLQAAATPWWWRVVVVVLIC